MPIQTLFLLCTLATLTSCHTTPPTADTTAPAHEILQATLQADVLTTIDATRHPSIRTLKNFIIETVSTLDNNNIIVKEICTLETKALNMVANDLNPEDIAMSKLLHERTLLGQHLQHAIEIYSLVIANEKKLLKKFQLLLNERITTLNELYTKTLRLTTNHSLALARLGFQALGVKEDVERTLCEDHIGCSCITDEQIVFFCSTTNAWPKKCQKIISFYVDTKKINCENNQKFHLLKNNIMQMTNLLHQLLKSNAETRQQLDIIRPDDGPDDGSDDGSDEERGGGGDGDEKEKLEKITEGIKKMSIDIIVLCKRFEDASKWTTQGYVEILSTTEMGAYHSQETLAAATTAAERESRKDALDELDGMFHPLDESV